MTSRRSFLRVGSLALGGLSLGDLLRLRARAEDANDRANTSVILLWLEGGPSHMETYDLKPDAPVEYRGEFSPIETAVPGLDVCELLPLHAQIADRFTVIRSIAHDVSDHPGAAGRFLTGRRPANISATVSEYPTFDSIVGRIREPNAQKGLPQFVSNKPALKGGGTAYLGQTSQPFVIEGDVESPEFEVENLTVNPSIENRMDDRLHLRRSFDGLRRDLDLSGALEAGDRFHQRAAELLSSTATRDAFDLSQESDATRERYGHTAWGRGALLARRLVEAGSSMITLDWGRIIRAVPTWDDHGDAQHIFKSMRIRLPPYDQALTALINEIHERGLDQRVLVIATGEFGRTPQVNMGRAKTPVFPGRDHWPGAMSVLVSGGGWKMGQVIGSTNSKGEYPHSSPFDPNDFLASVYRFLGIDPERAFLDRRGRPIPVLPYGKPIPELT